MTMQVELIEAVARGAASAGASRNVVAAAVAAAMRTAVESTDSQKGQPSDKALASPRDESEQLFRLLQLLDARVCCLEEARASKSEDAAAADVPAAQGVSAPPGLALGAAGSSDTGCSREPMPEPFEEGIVGEELRGVKAQLAKLLGRFSELSQECQKIFSVVEGHREDIVQLQEACMVQGAVQADVHHMSEALAKLEENVSCLQENGAKGVSEPATVIREQNDEGKPDPEEAVAEMPREQAGLLAVDLTPLILAVELTPVLNFEIDGNGLLQWIANVHAEEQLHAAGTGEDSGSQSVHGVGQQDMVKSNINVGEKMQAIDEDQAGQSGAADDREQLLQAVGGQAESIHGEGRSSVAEHSGAVDEDNGHGRGVLSREGEDASSAEQGHQSKKKLSKSKSEKKKQKAAAAAGRDSGAGISHPARVHAPGQAFKAGEDGEMDFDIGAGANFAEVLKNRPAEGTDSPEYMQKVMSAIRSDLQRLPEKGVEAYHKVAAGVVNAAFNAKNKK